MYHISGTIRQNNAFPGISECGKGLNPGNPSVPVKKRSICNGTYNQIVYLENFGGQNVNVSLTTSNWFPVNASQYMSVTWDHQYAILTPGLKEQAKIDLTVYANACSSGIPVNGFSFDIIVYEAW
jgi:hypothetical protein